MTFVENEPRKSPVLSSEPAFLLMLLLHALDERLEPGAGEAHAPAHVVPRVGPPRHRELRLVEHDLGDFALQILSS